MITVERSDETGYHLILEDGVVIAKTKSKAQADRVANALLAVEGAEIASEGHWTFEHPKAAAGWNARFLPGTRVRYWPILPPHPAGPPVVSKTRSEAWALGDGSSVVKIEGRTGGVRLSFLEVEVK